MKNHLKALLMRLGVYYRLRTSTVHDWYWMMADSQTLQARRTEISFYRELLDGFRKGDLIFDIGANHGFKTDLFLRLGAKVVAVEPNGYSREILSGKFLDYRLIKKPVTLVGKAVGESRGTDAMWIDGPGSALNTFSNKWVETLRKEPDRIGKPGMSVGFARQEKVELVTLDDLIAEHGVPFFIKIDVEGYEINVLRGLGRRVPYISFEVNLPEFSTEGLECLERLEYIAGGGAFNYADAADLSGLALTRWLPFGDFVDVFKQYSGPSIEVFWKSGY